MGGEITGLNKKKRICNYTGEMQQREEGKGSVCRQKKQV
jgi:hypothetical protein